MSPRVRRAVGAWSVFASLVVVTVIVLCRYPPASSGAANDPDTLPATASARGSLNLADPGQAYSYNFDLMARVISAEAKGEPYVGQVAVGAVILNRVDHPNFPKTIPGVVFEPDAFTAVSAGHIWEPPAATSVRAAQDALAGWDPVGGAVYYYNPAKATNWWVAGRRFIVQIGSHVFLR